LALSAQCRAVSEALRFEPRPKPGTATFASLAEPSRKDRCPKRHGPVATPVRHARVFLSPQPQHSLPALGLGSSPRRSDGGPSWANCAGAAGVARCDQLRAPEARLRACPPTARQPPPRGARPRAPLPPPRPAVQVSKEGPGRAAAAPPRRRRHLAPAPATARRGVADSAQRRAPPVCCYESRRPMPRGLESGGAPPSRARRCGGGPQERRRKAGVRGRASRVSAGAIRAAGMKRRRPRPPGAGAPRLRAGGVGLAPNLARARARGGGWGGHC